MRTRTLPLAATLLLSVVQMIPAQSDRSNSRQGQRDGGRMAENDLKAGDPAPDFKLKTPDGEKEISLNSSSGKRPVLLVFGSYT